MNHANEYKEFIEERIVGKDHIKLFETSDINSMNDNIKECLETFYSDARPEIRKIATILNSIYTHQNHVFLFSFRIMNDLLRNDNNITVNSCHINNYKYLLHRMQSSGMFEKKRSPKGRNAGLYKLKNPLFLKLLVELVGQDVLNGKEAAHTDWYDNEYKTKPNKDDVELEKEIAESKERINERKKRKANG